MSDQLPEKTKGRKAVKYRGAKCLNCGTPLDLSDVYCSYCGQLNTTKSLKLKDFFGEFLGSILTYDSRFRYTIKDLLFRPGVITRNYVNGQRLKYANPFRFFLSVSIIFFIVQGLISSFTGEAEQLNANFSDGESNMQISAGDGEVKVNGVLLDSILVQDTVANQRKLDTAAHSVIKEDSLQSYTHISETDLDTLSSLNRLVKRLYLYYGFYKTTKIKDPQQALDSLKHQPSKFNLWTYKKMPTIDQIKENPNDFISYLTGKTPFFVFFFTPFYALFFWLIYSKKKHTYMEHMVFIFHVFSFIFLALLIALLPDTLIGDIQQEGDDPLNGIFAGILFAIIGPIYFYKALRNFYKQNRLITIIKFLFLNGVFFVSATISGLIFFTITAAMY